MNPFQAVVLGVVEGLTEFLPVSSTGHLTVTEQLLGLKVDDKSVTAFTAVIQIGAILATFLYFRTDIVRLVRGFARGLISAEGRADPDWRFAWCVIVGSAPIGVVGLAAKSVIEGPLRSVAVVAVALIGWSAVMWYAERAPAQGRGESALTVRDGAVIGLVQCAALVPGVSRSGATISAGLLRGINRVEATRLSFFLAIPALTAAGLLELPKSLSGGVGLTATVIGTVVSFVVAYATIAWLLRFVASHSIAMFIPYRVAAGLVILVLLITGAIS